MSPNTSTSLLLRLLLLLMIEFLFVECRCCIEEHNNNTKQKFFMSTDPPTTTTFDQFIEHWTENFIVYFEDFRTKWKSFWLKSNQRNIFFTIAFSFILLTFLTIFILEFRRILKTFRQCFQTIFKSIQFFVIYLRNLLLKKTTPSILSFLLNSNSFFRQKFIKEFLRTLNKNFVERKVKKVTKEIQNVNC